MGSVTDLVSVVHVQPFVQPTTTFRGYRVCGFHSDRDRDHYEKFLLVSGHCGGCHHMVTDHYERRAKERISLPITRGDDAMQCLFHLLRGEISP